LEKAWKRYCRYRKFLQTFRVDKGLHIKEQAIAV
jgi:hypothetical protein